MSNNSIFKKWFLKKYHLFFVILLLLIYQHSLLYINAGFSILSAYLGGQLDKANSIGNVNDLIGLVKKLHPPFWFASILLILVLGIGLIVAFFTRNFVQSFFSVSNFLEIKKAPDYLKEALKTVYKECNDKKWKLRLYTSPRAQGKKEIICRKDHNTISIYLSPNFILECKDSKKDSKYIEAIVLHEIGHLNHKDTVYRQLITTFLTISVVMILGVVLMFCVTLILFFPSNSIQYKMGISNLIDQVAMLLILFFGYIHSKRNMENWANAFSSNAIKDKDFELSKILSPKRKTIFSRNPSSKNSEQVYKNFSDVVGLNLFLVFILGYMELILLVAVYSPLGSLHMWIILFLLTTVVSMMLYQHTRAYTCSAGKRAHFLKILISYVLGWYMGKVVIYKSNFLLGNVKLNDFSFFVDQVDFVLLGILSLFALLTFIKYNHAFLILLAISYFVAIILAGHVEYLPLLYKQRVKILQKASQYFEKQANETAEFLTIFRSAEERRNEIDIDFYNSLEDMVLDKTLRNCFKERWDKINDITKLADEFRLKRPNHLYYISPDVVDKKRARQVKKFSFVVTDSNDRIKLVSVRYIYSSIELRERYWKKFIEVIDEEFDSPVELYPDSLLGGNSGGFTFRDDQNRRLQILYGYNDNVAFAELRDFKFVNGSISCSIQGGYSETPSCLLIKDLVLKDN